MRETRSDNTGLPRSGAAANRLLQTLVVRSAPPLFAAVLLLVIWSAVVAYWDIKPFIAPPPTAVLRTLLQDRQVLWDAWCLTGQAALIGLALSLLCGTLVGILFSQSTVIRYAFYPYAVFLQTVPIVAVAPLLVMWLGYGGKGVIAVAFILSLFPIVANVTAGILAVPRPWRELFSLYNASRWQTLCKLQLPYAMPFLVTGARTSSGLSVIGAIVGEFFVGYGDQGFGLGYLIRSSADNYRTPSLFAAVVLSTLLGVSVFGVVSLLAEWTMRRWGQ